MVNALNNLDDESLMGYVKQHNHQAFSILVERHSKRFYAIAYRVVMQQQLAEDIVQDSFLKLWDKPTIWKDKKGAKFTSWFHRIVTNMAIDLYRRNKKILAFDNSDDFATQSETQLSEIEQSQTQIALDEAIKTLPEKQLLALNLCFYEDMAREEAANIIGVKTGALNSLLMRAKENIREHLIRNDIIKEDVEGKIA